MKTSIVVLILAFICAIAFTAKAQSYYSALAIQTIRQAQGGPGMPRDATGNPGRSRAVQGGLGRSRAVQGGPGRSRAVQGGPGRPRAV